MKFAKFLQDFFWTIPFLCFVVGYTLLQVLVVNKKVSTPNFIGKTIHEAVTVASKHKLSLQIITKKETTDLKPGTIIKQKPSSGKPIKNGQSIYVITTKQPDIPQSPNLLQKNLEQIEAACSKKKIKNRSYYIESNLPEGRCFGQNPQPLEQVPSKKIDTYISKQNKLPYLFPNLIGQNITSVSQFLEKHNLNYQVFYNRNQITNFDNAMIITHQKPLAGSFVEINNKLSIHLQVDTN